MTKGQITKQQDVKVIELESTPLPLLDLVGEPRIATPVLDQIVARHDHVKHRSTAVRHAVDKWLIEQHEAHQVRVDAHRVRAHTETERRAKRSAAAKRGAETRRRKQLQQAQAAFEARKQTPEWQYWAREVTDSVLNDYQFGLDQSMSQHNMERHRVQDPEQAFEEAAAVQWALTARSCGCGRQFKDCWWYGGTLSKGPRRHSAY